MERGPSLGILRLRVRRGVEQDVEALEVVRRAAPRRPVERAPAGGDLQASLPVVDNNRKVVGALSVVGEAPPQNKNGCWKK